jgi:phosphoglycolate phosphatase
MISGILFDKDATLLDFGKMWGDWAYTHLSELAMGDDGLFHRLAAAIEYDPATRNFAPSSPVIAGTPEEGVDLILPHLPNWTRDALLRHSNDTARTAPVHAIVPLDPVLSRLGQTAKLGIATNDSAHSARTHMETLGIAHHFTAILGSDSGHGGKPAPGMCLAFADQTGLDPAQIAMVGDSLHDLHAGRAAGMICVAVTSGFATAQELSPFADVVLGDVSELPDWVAAR